ncbi:hypothetical protein EVAR_78093_1 [Eumeta japonica]|uniref:Uncharacterized protein n=1 Tax=Eumeta variegata TaxID=151549 RepID=A0A4C1T0H3_EUMVA|nr:hypothetical protein EVAR_78093_1 [Eumeta japonica]
MGRPCARAHGDAVGAWLPYGCLLSEHLGIGGHEKFTARTETSKRDSGRCEKRTGLMTFTELEPSSQLINSLCKRGRMFRRQFDLRYSAMSSAKSASWTPVFSRGISITSAEYSTGRAWSLELVELMYKACAPYPIKGLGYVKEDRHYLTFDFKTFRHVFYKTEWDDTNSRRKRSSSLNISDRTPAGRAARIRIRFIRFLLCAAAVSFYSDAYADELEETSLVPRSRSHARFRRNATMRVPFSCVQPAFINL